MTIALGLLLALAPAPAAVASLPVQADTPVSTAAMQLARTLNSEGGTQVESERMFSGGELAAALRSNPDMAETEREYPGIVDHIVIRMRPAVERMTRDALPKLWERTARLFDVHMTPSEIAQAQAFYGSPAGQRLIDAVSRNFDFKPMLGEATTDKDISAGSFRQGVAAGMPAIIAGMSKADQAVLLAFGSTAAFAKIQKLNPEVMRVKAAWANETTPEQDAELEAIVTRAAEEFMAAKDAQE